VTRLKKVLLLTLLVLLIPATVANADTVNVEIIDREGKPVAGATVMLCNMTSCPWTATTDTNGVATLDVPRGEYLLVAIKDKLSIIDIVSVENATKVLLDLRNMHYAHIDSKPIHVTFKASTAAYNKTVELSTPIDLYARLVVSIEFPGEVEIFPFVYKLEKIEYDGNSVENQTSIELAMDKDYNVTAHYSQQFIAPLDTPMLVALALIVLIGIIVAWKAAAETARDIVAGDRRFVKKVGRV